MMFAPASASTSLPPAAQPGFYAARLASPAARQGGAVLAPMAGYSDAPMRQLAAEQGALWTVSEMISSRGLALGSDTESLNLGRPYAGEVGRVVQLFGAEPDVLAAAVAKAEGWFAPAAIDLNMGCPVPKVRGKGGACLLQTPELAFELIRAMRGATKLDVSAKIRLGWDSNRSLEVAQGLAEAGAAIVTVHGRTSAQRYTGEADWDAIAAVAASVNVPVIGSGDIRSVAQARQRRQSGVSAVMIGRGAVGNPWIFRALATGDDAWPSLSGRAATALRHAELHIQFYAGPLGTGRVSLLPLRKVLPQYLPDVPDLRGALVKIETLEQLRDCLMPYLESSLMTDRAGDYRVVAARVNTTGAP
ncbi:tRNA-dihydrouridine synthase [Deinococcus sp. QL22]|uniref:tRNA dihydrouridine synthase n=1 Tax=Deinococcus sp. QL22 TaxID=2939437 RepID=UPI002016B940|nr:tRNA-dihydrouridine synthase family protein [Deinococcus sp. QL22]UQN04955.1 tRNA-dihydrouridine synthase family protein [Deinococcus sp. QL22]